jgi:hypothetical protein
MLPMRVAPQSKTPLYLGDHVERPMLVVLDTDTIQATNDPIDSTALLLGFLLHGGVEVYRYSDHGAPAGTPVADFEWFPPASIGWLTVVPLGQPGIASHRLIYSDGEHLNETAIVDGQIVAVSGALARSSPGLSATELTADATLMLAASEIGADVLITNRPSVLAERQLSLSNGLTVANTAEATGILGLFFRSRRDFIATKAAHGTFTYNKGLFWQTAVGIHLPNWLDVVGRGYLLDISRGDGSSAGTLIAASVRKLSRTFERRDAIWRLIDQKQDRDIAEDSLAAFDSFLVFLMGSFDALARATNGILQLGAEPRFAGWQFKKWTGLLRAANPQIASLFVTGSRHRASIELLGSLRNLIHAEGLDSIAVGPSHRAQATWIIVPSADAGKLLAAVDLLGDRDEWGLHLDTTGRVMFELCRLVENLLLNCLSSTRAIFAAIGLALETMTASPPIAPDSGVNDDLLHLHIQWQLGLGLQWTDIDWDGIVRV